MGRAPPSVIIRYSYDGHLLKIFCDVSSRAEWLDINIFVNGTSVNSTRVKNITKSITVTLEANVVGSYGEYDGVQIVCYGINGQRWANSVTIADYVTRSSPPRRELPSQRRVTDRSEVGRCPRVELDDVDENEDDDVDENKDEPSLSTKDALIIVFVGEGAVLLIVWCAFGARYVFARCNRNPTSRRDRNPHRRDYVNALNI